MCARTHPDAQARVPEIYGDMHVKGNMTPDILHAITPWISSAVAVRSYGFGEPLLSPLFETLVRRAKRAGAYVDFFTNGHLLSKEKSEFLVEYEVDRIVLSASGSSEVVYRKIHGAPLEDLKKGVETLLWAMRRTGKIRPRIDLNVIVQQENVEQLENFLSLAQVFGVTTVSFKPLMTYDDQMKREAVDLGQDTILRRLETIKREAAHNGIDVDWSVRDQRTGPNGPACFMPWRSVFVQWDGKVRSDCFGGPILGDLHVQTPKDIWEGEVARTFRNAMAKAQYPDSCRFCLEQHLRPLQDDLRAVFALTGATAPEQVRPEETTTGKPGPWRISMVSRPGWSFWNNPFLCRVVISTRTSPRKIHLVLSLYPRESPSYPQRHHGYWTFWNVPLEQEETELELELQSPRCLCRLKNEVFHGEFTAGKLISSEEYILDLSLRCEADETLAELRSRQVFLESQDHVKSALDQHWPEHRRRHPKWMEPDRITLLSLSKEIRSFAESYARTGVRIVDLGCGDKPYYPFFHGFEADYLGVDFFPGPYVDLIAEKPPFDLPESSFDLCLMTQVLEHVREPNIMTQEAYRLLKPGGRLFLSAPLLWEVHYVPMDYYRFTEEALRELTKGFLVERCVPCCGPRATLFQCRNLLSQRNTKESWFSRWTTVLRNLLLQILQEEEDPTFTSNFVMIAKKPGRPVTDY